MSRDNLLDNPRPRRFQLYRRADVNGMSGTGIVAEGIEHRDGSVQYHWLTAPGTWQMAQSIHDVEHIHGHGGKTSVRWLDDPEQPGEEKTLQEVYEDRNRLAVGFAVLSLEIEGLTTESGIPGRLRGYKAGWQAPGDDDDADADRWAIVWSQTPDGQVSWHVPRGLATLSKLPERTCPWDGHTRREKNDRMLSLASGED